MDSRSGSSLVWFEFVGINVTGNCSRNDLYSRAHMQECVWWTHSVAHINASDIPDWAPRHWPLPTGCVLGLSGPSYCPLRHFQPILEFPLKWQRGVNNRQPQNGFWAFESFSSEVVFECDHIYSFVIFMFGPGKKSRKLPRTLVTDKPTILARPDIWSCDKVF